MALPTEYQVGTTSWSIEQIHALDARLAAVEESQTAPSNLENRVKSLEKKNEADAKAAKQNAANTSPLADAAAKQDAAKQDAKAEPKASDKS